MIPTPTPFQNTLGPACQAMGWRHPFAVVCLVMLLMGTLASNSVAQDQTSADQTSGVHLFILSGQSNMAGLKPEESFTPAVESAFGKDHVLVVKDAQGGEPIRRWYKDWKTDNAAEAAKIGDLYERLMQKVNEAKQGKQLESVTFIWMQGERDAREQNADRYAEALQGVVAQLRKDLHRDQLYVVIGRLSDFDMENRRYPHWTKIREVQVALADSEENFAWVDTDDLNDGVNRNGKPIRNDLHYSAEGYKTLGTRFAEKSIELIRDSRN